MSIQTFQNLEAVIPNQRDVKLARQSSKMLSRISLGKVKSIDIILEEANNHNETISLPLPAFKLLVTILTEMGQGNAVTLIPMHAALTTQKAADLLNVSRPYLIQLLESNKIPFHKVGNRRKVLFQDLMLYKAKIDDARRKVLDDLANEAQKLNLGY